MGNRQALFITHYSSSITNHPFLEILPGQAFPNPKSKIQNGIRTCVGEALSASPTQVPTRNQQHCHPTKSDESVMPTTVATNEGTDFEPGVVSGEYPEYSILLDESAFVPPVPIVVVMTADTVARLDSSFLQ